MAQYPIKMLKDENGTPFVPLVAPEAVKDNQGTDWQALIDKKLEKTNIIAGDNITLSVSGNDITINSQAGGSVGSSAVIISSYDDDATKIEKLLSAEKNGKLVKPLFYESNGGGNEIAGVYNFFQSYSDSNGKTFLFTLLLDVFYEVVFTIGGGELQNVLTKEAVMIPWQAVLGDTGWLYTSNTHKSDLGAWYNYGLAGALYGRKVGNTVQLNSVFRFDGGFDEPAIFQLNEAFRPAQKIYAVLLITDTEGDVSSATKCNISIDINGYIRIEDSAVLSDIAGAPSSLYLYGTIMYFV